MSTARATALLLALAAVAGCGSSRRAPVAPSASAAKPPAAVARAPALCRALRVRVGDNGAQRASIDVYRVAEPRVGDDATAPAQRLRLHYPDGAHDAEALLVDPLRADLVVVTKALGGASAYRASARLPAGSETTLGRGRGVAGVSLVTGGDVSADGRVVALRGYDRVAVWLRHGRERLTTTLRRAPCFSPTSLLPEGQGEAIALDRHGRSFLTVAEGAPAVLRRYVPRG